MMEKHQFQPGLHGGEIVCDYYATTDLARCGQVQDHRVHRGVGVPEPGDINYLRVGSAHRTECPFQPCGQQVHIMTTKPYWTFEQHLMPDHAIGGTGQSCPASLMRYPMRGEERHALQEMTQSFLDQLGRSVLNGQTDDPPSSGKLPESTTLRQPGRIGREPGPRSNAWHLGGRRDEDVIPVGEEKVGEIPPNVGGQSVGGRGMDIDETAGIIQAARAMAGEAMATIMSAKAAIENAKRAVAQVSGQTPGETLQNHARYLDNSLNELDQAQTQLELANEQGEGFIQRLYS